MAVTGDPTKVCEGCYAMSGFYGMPTVLKAQWRRFLWVKHLLKSPEGRATFIATMVAAIKSHSKNGYFRWFDSGDIFAPQFAECLYEVCRLTPGVKHWFPTRSWQAKTDAWQNPLKKLAALPNVVVRPSGLSYNDEPPALEGYGPGTTVITTASKAKRLGCKVCPKTLNHSGCEAEGCRSCWSKDKQIAYIVHGRFGTSERSSVMTEGNLRYRQSIAKQLTQLTVSA